MNITAFYQLLMNEDWHTSWSDDPSVYWAGEVSHERIHQMALTHGPAFAWLLSEFRKREFSGPAWGTTNLPHLPPPTEPTISALIDLRADFEQLAFVSGEQDASCILGRCKYLGAIYPYGDTVPALISSVGALRKIWREGQNEAVLAHQSLRPAADLDELLRTQTESLDRQKRALQGDRMEGDVNVSALHPTLGRLYWRYVYEGDCNMPDYYSITDQVRLALQLPEDWRDDKHLHWMHKSHLSDVLTNDMYGDYWQEEDEDTFETIHCFDGHLADLQTRSGQSGREFVNWLLTAEWVDVPRPKNNDDSESSTQSEIGL
ncbi:MULTISPECIES: hypothetical protein [Pseudomonas]|uniref:Uncharacterized protein n=1 Tax=Pseudomonas syringae pv. actinidiae TaxID=103796 RepID=A0A2P0QF15_PSESF|nr:MULTISPECIES: hypothetical protein [Pseudomonas]ARO44965.1 hypothetical protein [Pseudomonas syringae pv. actinidiae]ARO45070.1 hypothetical protein [Pseudomonas syringae pv. actinidiae]ARO45161.1 hypothetical protein [Pseudomonas syringae pv. actinidiae]ARO45203.1 hypothetical protein [Pseudomonas syringae pv. actinidiae]MDU8387919.1 hypothetical protein [Pseudomonas syringae pv. actinidiae]